MVDDPRPWLRCRCVHRSQDPEWNLLSDPDPYYHRCPDRPTQEDGLCDHCRGDACGVMCPRFWCCQQPGQRRLLVDLTIPCLDLEVP